MAHERDNDRRITVDFAAWLDPKQMEVDAFFRSGLVVLDANVLLDLYRVTPTARTQVLDAFARIKGRLWVPHQAAVEFSRNRKSAVIERISSFKETQRLLKAAAAEAVIKLEAAVASLLKLRARNRTDRKWTPKDFSLDGESLHARLDGVMEPALNELGELEAEHDLHPKDMQQIDRLLLEVDALLAGRIGQAYSPGALRNLVEEALTFRFPNEIPPGFRDADKVTPVRAAGDYILWRQTLDKAATLSSDRRVLLVTNDMKRDWWELDKKQNVIGSRPELIQEMRDQAGCDLLIVNLRGFIAGAKEHLSSSVSDETIEQLQEVSDEVDSLLPSIFRESSAEVNLSDLHPNEVERLAQWLLIKTGFNVEAASGPSAYDLLISSAEGEDDSLTLVEVKAYRQPMGVSAIYQVRGAMQAFGAQAAMVITTSWFSPSAKAAAEDVPIELIDGNTFASQLARHGLNVAIPPIQKP